MKRFSHVLPNGSFYDVLPIKALSDNYMYLIIDKATKKCAAIDCVEPQKVLDIVKSKGLELTSVLTTHSHWDHDGGNPVMRSLTKLEVYGGKGDGVKAVTKEVDENTKIIVGNLTINVLQTEFHTPGHVCYYVKSQKNVPGSVFTGDTLFIGGCGNLNSGTKEQLHRAFSKLGNLPTETLVWVGHEYTVANLSYALSVEKSDFLVEKFQWASKQQTTIPSTIGEEHATSPFMKAAFGKSEAVKSLCGSDDPIEQIYFVRKHKSSGKWKQIWNQLKNTL